MAVSESRLTPRQLQVPGKLLPPAVPLVLHNDYQWNPQDGCIRSSRREGQPDKSAQLWVNGDAVELLKTIHKPVAVLAICGPYRTGKSYFLSRLMCKPGTFKLGHSMDVCTRGIWLSTTALECEEFVLLLLDTEGIGAVEGEGPESSTIKLLVTTTLLSSTLVYNSNEVPQHSDLEQMSFFTHLTQCISVSEDATNHSTHEELQKHFPKFVWLLRNVINLPEDEDGNEVPLKTYLHSEAICSTKQSRLVNETLQAVFPSIDYQYLPPPSVDPAETADLDGRWDLLEEEFKEKIDKVVQYFLENVAPKRAFDQTTLVSGVELALLLTDHVEAINTPGRLPSLEGSWMAVLKLRLKKVFSQTLEKYAREMEERTADSLPIEEDVPEGQDNQLTLMQLHWLVFDECHRELKREMECLVHHQNDCLNRYCTSLLAEFAQQAANFESCQTGDLLGTETLQGGILLRFVHENYRQSEEMCDELWARLFEESGIHSRAVRALNQSKVVDLSTDMVLLEQEYLAQAVGPAKLEVLRRKQAANDVKAMLCTLPGPPERVRLAGQHRDKRKIVWDPPSINPDAARKYVIQKKTKTGGWEDLATTDRKWVVLEHQPSKESWYRVTSWNDDAKHNTKGEMEEPLIVSKGDNIPNTEGLTYL